MLISRAGESPQATLRSSQVKSGSAGTESPEAVVNPKTEETIVLSDPSPAQVDAAVDAAAKAFQSWSSHHPRRTFGAPLEACRCHRP